MTYLLLVSIGPVQDFIATARRSRDLWFGSWLLSELSKSAAKAIADQPGSELIFPNPAALAELEPNTDLNVANKIVAVIQQPLTPGKEADYIQQALWSRLRDIRRKAYQYVNGSYEKEIAYKQVDDLPEFFWVTAPFNEGLDHYSDARTRAEALLAARKNTRDFKRVEWGANKPKSSLDGRRESVIPEKAYAERNAPAKERQKAVQALFTDYGARTAERLSGVDLMKRHGHRGPQSAFPSTSHIASLPLSDQLRRETGPDHWPLTWASYLEKIPPNVLKQEKIADRNEPHPILGRVDGSLLFESRLAEYFAEDETGLTTAKEALHDFLTAVGGEKTLTPMPYYALLLADGDGMGQLIDAQEAKADHQHLSATLNRFANQVAQIVEQHHRGALVYAGGDDVLAFLPLHTALDCAVELATTFNELMEAADFKDKTREQVTATLSAGVAISHHLSPLSDALDLARQAEKTAKGMKGKNALAVAVDMRSGAPRMVKGRWGDLDKRLKQFIQFHRSDALPDGAAYELREASLRLGGDDAIRQNPALQAIIKKEAARIFGRKRAQRGAVQVADKIRKDLEAFVADPALPVAQLADELIISHLLAQAKDQAGLPHLQEGDAA
ncbi:MAG TPA: type III-B CRISPR-associated protein Cas10/Cmr2 [Anaerolineae bacterium]|nr:type III-B CRISPR-associated protein Cas10/Cmr2 [Anaerolineae bacterium]